MNTAVKLGVTVLVGEVLVRLEAVERISPDKFRFTIDSDCTALYQPEEKDLRDEAWECLRDLQFDGNPIMKNVQLLNGHFSSKFSIQGDMIEIEIR